MSITLTTVIRAGRLSRLGHATPWTTSHLKCLEEHPASLRYEQLRTDAPTPLVDVLHLAAQADVRFLIFAPDAGILDGLPIYPE